MTIFRSLKTNFQTQGFGIIGTKPDMLPFYQSIGLKAHNGFDWAAKDGEKIYWDCDKRGIVLNTHTDSYGGLGVTVISEDKYKHIFWHLKGFACKAGDILDSGDLIGYADNTGRSTGTHLHRGLKRVAKNKYGNYYTLNKDNGYKGAVFFPIKNIYVKDYIKSLETRISLFKKVIEIANKLIKLWKKI